MADQTNEIKKSVEEGSLDDALLIDGIEKLELNEGKFSPEVDDQDHHQAPNDEDCLTDEEILTEEEKSVMKEESVILKLEGNELFNKREYKDAVGIYTSALKKCPKIYGKERAILYANRAACKMKLGSNESAVEDCNKALENDSKYVKAILRRASLYETLEKLDEALQDYKTVLEIDPQHTTANVACQALPSRIQERNEKLKTEMLGKLKDLGNMILRPFGLSTNNFQMQQDPNSGGYSVNFKQNQP